MIKDLKKVKLTGLYVVIMSRTSFRVNPHSILLPECLGTPWSKQTPYLKFKL